jgi:tetratricopeptide (TPR) repeat protein
VSTRAAGPADPDAYAALKEQRDFLLGSLDDLERERAAGDIDEADYEALRDDYTARAAAVLRALDDGGARFASARRKGSWKLGAAVIVGVLVFGAGAGLLVARSSGSRNDGASGGGGALVTRDDLAECLNRFSQGDVLEAVMCYDEVLADDPDNLEALTYRGWALVQSTLVDDGLEYLDRAIALDPSYPDARVFRAIAYRDQERYDDARADLAVVDAGQVPVAMAPLIEQLRAELDAAAGSPTTAPPQG